MEIKANELAIKEIASIKNTIITATAENRRDILKAFNDFELQTELKARGILQNSNAIYQAENELLKEALKRLNGREREIMELRYGLSGGEEKTQREVADMLGISQSYISRLEKRILLRLRREMQKIMA